MGGRWWGKWGDVEGYATWKINGERRRRRRGVVGVLLRSIPYEK
jgi:hypothetical protein